MLSIIFIASNKLVFKNTLLSWRIVKRCALKVPTTRRYDMHNSLNNAQLDGTVSVYYNIF